MVRTSPHGDFPQFALPITCALSPRSWGGAWKTRWKPPIPCTAADGGANRKRTTFRRNRFRTYDAFALGALALLSVGAAAAAYTLMNGFGFFPAFHGSLGNPLAALYALALCFPLMLELLGKVRR